MPPKQLVEIPRTAPERLGVASWLHCCRGHVRNMHMPTFSDIVQPHVVRPQYGIVCKWSAGLRVPSQEVIIPNRYLLAFCESSVF